MCQSSQPVQQQQASTELPEWAKPYAKDILAKGQALTDVNQNPYQIYNQPRIAGFSPMQQQAMQGAAGMSVAPQIGAGTAYAAGAGLGGLGVAGQATTGGFQGQVGGYMNPYLQMALAPQLAEANRQYDIGAAKQQSAATQAGAFGGSREAIMAAENERNRNTALNQIVGQGYNQAFQQAQQQYNQNLQNQLAGYGLLGQSAGQLGQLGQTQYGQQMGINQLQAGYGAQQQAQEQKGLDLAYQDFLNQQNYPYKQLGFMSDMIRGLPLGQQSTSAIYQGPPTALQTAGALGLGAYGAKQLGMFAEGGSVTSEDNVRAISRFLPPQQLPTSYQLAQARSDLDAQAALQKQMAENASLQRGLGSAFNALPPETQDGVVRAAGGGILAFNGDEDSNDQISGQLISSPGNPALYNRSLQEAMDYNAAIGKFKGTTMTPEQEREYVQKQYDLEKGLAGSNAAADQFRAYLQGAEGDRAAALEQSKGLAALQAASAMLQPGGTIRGLGAAGSAFAGEYSKGLQADRAMKHQLAMANFNLADAERKERMGYTKSAMESLAKRQANLQAADKLQLDVLKSQGSTAARIAQAARPIKTGAGAKGPKDTDIIVQKELELAVMDPSDPKYGNLKKEVDALRDYQGRKAAGLPGVTARTEATAEENAIARTDKRLLGDVKYNEAQRKKDDAGMQKRRAEILAEERKAPPAGGAPTGGAGAITPDAFAAKWSTLKKGETLTGPDGVTYTKQ